jgi:hypothetical protein
MEKFFVPYKADKPVCVSVNGHDLIIVTADIESLMEAEFMEHDSLQEYECDLDEVEELLADIGMEHQTGVVLAPADIEPKDFIESLSQELPWIQ